MNRYTLLSLILLLGACKTTRTVSQSAQTHTKDSSSVQGTEQIKDSYAHIKETITKDTAIGISERIVADTIKADDATPVRNAAGRAKPRYFEKNEKGLSTWVYIDTTGNIAYGCKADSYTLVVKQLTRINDSLIHTNMQMQISSTVRHTNRDSAISTMQEKKATAWGQAWNSIKKTALMTAVTLLACGLAYLLLRKYLKLS